MASRCSFGVFLAFAILAMPVTAELYRYKNEDGVTVLNSHVPARYVRNGYAILSNSGRVLEVVPRALTNEEIRQRDLRLAREEAAASKRREQEVVDQNLMRLYSTPGDVIRARDARLGSIDGMINAQQSNIQRLEIQKRDQESVLADIQRRGEVISDERIERLQQIGARIEQLEQEIADKQDEKQRIVVSFAADLARVKELYRN